MPVEYGSVLDYSDRGFGFVSCTLRSASQLGLRVFFHIKTIRRKYPHLADKLDNGSHSGVSFWYDTESTHRGDQVKDLWLQVDEMPAAQRTEARTRVEQLFQEAQRSLPAGFDKLALEMLGKADFERLRSGRERLRAQQETEAEKQRQADEQRRRAEAEAQKHRQVEEQRTRAQPGRPLASQAQRASMVPLFTPLRPPPPAQSSADSSYFFERVGITGGTGPTNAPTGPREIETKVVGVTYENRQAVVSQLAKGEQVWLRRELTNPYDHNAIRVERQNGQQIGYISRPEAAIFVASFDAHGQPVPAVVTAIVTGYSALGVRIRFTLPDAGGYRPPSIRDFDWEP